MKAEETTSKPSVLTLTTQDHVRTGIFSSICFLGAYPIIIPFFVAYPIISRGNNPGGYDTNCKRRPAPSVSAFPLCSDQCTVDFWPVVIGALSLQRISGHTVICELHQITPRMMMV